MKSLLQAVLSLTAVLALGTMGSGLLRVHAAAAKPYRITISSPIAARTVNVKVDGKITIWSNAPGFNSPKVEPLHTLAKLVQDPVKGIWTITIANLSIPLDSGIVLTLPKGNVASGVFRPSTNSATLTVPLKGIPLAGTIQFSLSTDSSVTTTSKQTIRGRRVDQKGNITLIGTKSHIGFFNNQAQISIQSVLSPWPLRANSLPNRK
jgi:hypothetical protein